MKRCAAQGVHCLVDTRLEMAAPDGYRLGAQLFARADLRDPADAVVFNAGGGLSSLRYRHFLRFLAQKGMPVLAYDYRGVGMSRPPSWRNFDAGIEDWCELDQVSAIEAIRSRFPAARLSSVSHSIGCMIAAAAPNAPALHQMVFIAPHTAYWGDYLQPWRWPMALMWHVLMPAVARVIGHFPAADSAWATTCHGGSPCSGRRDGRPTIGPAPRVATLRERLSLWTGWLG